MAQSNHRLVPARSGLPGESLAAPSVREPIDAHKRDMVAFGSYQGSRKRDRHPQSQGLYQTISGTIPEDDYWKQRHGKRTQQSQLQLQLDLQKKELEVERLKQLNEALRWQTSGSIDQVNQQSQQSREQSLLQSLLLLVAASPALNLAEMGAQINQVPVCGTQESAANSGLDLVAGLLKQLQHTSGTMDDQQKCSLGVPLPAGQVSGTAAPQSLSSSFQDSVVATTSSVTGNQQVQMVADALVQAAVDSIQAGLRATGGPGLAALVHAQGGANSLPSGQSTASCQLTGGTSQVPVAANLCVGPQNPAMPFSLINSQIPGAANLSLESQVLLATKQPGQSQVLAAGHVGAGMQMPAMTSMMNPTGVTSVWPGPQVPVAANLPSPQVPVAVNLPGAQVPFAVNYPNPQVQGAAGLFHPQLPGAVNLFDPQVQGAANLVNLPVQVAVNQPNQPQVPAAVNLPLGVVEIKVEDEGVPLPPSPMEMKMEDEGIPLPESPVGAEKDKETNTAEREEKGRGWLGLWCPGAGPGDPPSQFLPEPQFYPTPSSSKDPPPPGQHATTPSQVASITLQQASIFSPVAEKLAHPEFSSFERQTGNLFGKKVLQKSNLGKLGNSWSDLLQVRVQQIKSLWTPGRIGKRGNFPSPMGSLGVVSPLGTNLDFSEPSLDPSQGKTGKFCQSQGSEATFQGNSSTPSGFQGLLSTATESTSSEVSPPPSQGGEET